MSENPFKADPFEEEPQPLQANLDPQELNVSRKSSRRTSIANSSTPSRRTSLTPDPNGPPKSSEEEPNIHDAENAKKNANTVYRTPGRRTSFSLEPSVMIIPRNNEEATTTSESENTRNPSDSVVRTPGRRTSFSLEPNIMIIPGNNEEASTKNDSNSSRKLSDSIVRIPGRRTSFSLEPNVMLIPRNNDSSISNESVNHRKPSDSVTRNSGRRTSFSLEPNVMHIPGNIPKNTEEEPQSSEPKKEVEDGASSSSSSEYEAPQPVASTRRSSIQVLRSFMSMPFKKEPTQPLLETEDEDEGDFENRPPPFIKNVSGLSFNSSNGSNADGGGKLLNESILTKLQFMQYCFYALGLISLGFYFSKQMTDGFGVQLSVGVDQWQGFSTICFTFILLLTHLFTVKSFERAITVAISMLLTSKSGFAGAIVGAAQGSLFDQISVFTKLAARSKARNRFLLIIFSKIVQQTLILLIPFIFVNLYNDKQQLIGRPLSCIEYNQIGYQNDRGWPSLEVAMGVGEYAAATSVGILRAEEKVESTQFFSPPQLIDVADDGTKIFGNGYTAFISSNCLCSASEKSADLIDAGIDASVALDMEDQIKQLRFEPGMANFIKSSETAVKFQSALTATDLCGSKINGIQPLLVCYTDIHSIQDAVIQVEYMTDGNPASIAVKRTNLKSIKSNADISWLYNGFNYLFGGNVSHTFLPASSPNSLNSLLTWATDTAQHISATRISEGVEGMFSILTKAAIQRSFNTVGSKCPQIIKDKSTQVALLRPEATSYYYFFYFAELFFILISGAVLMLWLNYKTPISPAIRFIDEKSYFMVLTSRSMFSKNLQALRGMYSESEFWAKLDNIVRIGESRNTLDDAESGLIVIASPKMVYEFSWNKLYK